MTRAAASSHDGHAHPSWWDRGRLWGAILLLVTALFCGGSSWGAPLRYAIVEVVAVLVMVYTIAAPKTEGQRLGVLPIVLIAGIALLFVLQLVPLPFETWSHLPGRQLAADILRVTGAGTGSRPLTMDAERTISSGLSLLPALAMLLAAVYASNRDRLILAWCALGVVTASFLLGAAQMISGTGAAALTPFNTTNVGQPIGFFANSNHQADLMLIGFVFAGLLMPSLKGSHRHWLQTPILFFGLMAAFMIAIVLNNSRMAMLLLTVALLAVLVRRSSFNRLSGVVITVALVAVCFAALASWSQLFSNSIAGFSDLDDPRYGIWPDVLYAIFDKDQYRWAGSGIGTFEPVFKTVETLGGLGPHFINHAHNDYLEIVMEAGVFGAALLALYLVIVALSSWKVLRAAPGPAANTLAYAGLISILLVMAHSLVDYPLRTPLISTMFALCWAMVLAPLRERVSRREN